MSHLETCLVYVWWNIGWQMLLWIDWRRQLWSSQSIARKSWRIYDQFLRMLRSFKKARFLWVKDAFWTIKRIYGLSHKLLLCDHFFLNLSFELLFMDVILLSVLFPSFLTFSGRKNSARSFNQLLHHLPVFSVDPDLILISFEFEINQAIPISDLLVISWWLHVLILSISHAQQTIQ